MFHSGGTALDVRTGAGVRSIIGNYSKQMASNFFRCACRLAAGLLC
jgi:hypothetical protein